MKTKLGLLALAGMVCFSASLNARDITMFDGQGPGWGVGNWNPFGGAGPTGHDQLVKEDNEVEPPDEVSQVWDLEALIWNSSTRWNNSTKSYDAAPNTRSLGVLSGYDTSKGVVEAGSAYRPSDIFISIDGNPNPTVNSIAQGYRNINNRTSGAGASFNNALDGNGIAFEYVIHFLNQTGTGTTGSTGGAVTDAPWTGQFKVYKLNAKSTLRSAAFNQNSRSNPWRYLGGLNNGTPSDATDDALEVFAGTATLHGIVGSKLTDLQAKKVSDGFGSDFSGFPGRTIKGDVRNVASHYYLEVPMDWTKTALPRGNVTLGGHVSMGCGNDELVGSITFSNTNVPDSGTTLILLGAGLSGFSLMGRRKRSS